MNNDLISREALKKAITEATYNFEQIPIRVDEVMQIIDNAPAIKTFTLLDIEKQYRKGLEKGLSEQETEKPKGKWIKIFSNPFTDGYVCPFCGHKIQVTEQFLPQVTECEVCGADMREDGAE